MNADDYLDPQYIEEQARADAIRAEAGEIRARDLGCASCAALRERAEAAEDVLKHLLEWWDDAPTGFVLAEFERKVIDDGARRVLAERGKK